MLDFFMNLVEVKSFGYNAITISSIITIVFSTFQGWGLQKQGKTIWKKHSGESISTITMMYGCAYFIMFLFYGLSQNSMVMTLNGLLGLVYIPILIGLWKFKGFSKKDWISGFVFFLLIPLMIYIPQKDELLLITLGGVLISQFPQIYELWKTKKPGAIEPKYLFIFMATNIFWFIYALTIDNWVLITFNPLSFLFLTITVILWFWYRTNK